MQLALVRIKKCYPYDTFNWFNITKKVRKNVFSGVFKKMKNNLILKLNKHLTYDLTADVLCWMLLLH